MFLQFVDEEHVKERLSLQLPKHFDFARRLLRFWHDADLNGALEKSSLPPVVLRILLAMTVRSCRQFRTVVELCERGEGTDATIIARSMFETALVIGFILKPRFIPRRFDGTGKGTRMGIPAVSLTREFRAILYVTHHVLEPERFAARHANRPGMRRNAKRMARIVAKDNVSSPYTKAVGPQWTKILMSSPRTYSGLSIADLARSLGRPFSGWYDQVYGWQSQHVHVQDLLHHMQFDGQDTSLPRWQESVQQIRGTLQSAIAMFYAINGMLNHHLEVGTWMNTALHAFAVEYKKLIAEE